MTLSDMLIWIGTGLAILGLIGLGFCVVRALAIRREGNAETGIVEMRKLVALNVASVGIASIGLAAVVVGVIL